MLKISIGELFIHGQSQKFIFLLEWINSSFIFVSAIISASLIAALRQSEFDYQLKVY